MSKAVGKLGKARKQAAEKVAVLPFLKTTINAGMATPAPPLGPQLGARGINVAQFCKEFNDKTATMLEGTPIPTRIFVNPDRTFKMTLQTPHTPWLIMRSAGIRRGSMEVGKTWVGKISRKQMYEIAKLKHQDEVMKIYSLQTVCRLVAMTAHTIGVQVVDSLDPDEYREFLEKRQEIVKRQLAELEEKKAAKMLRTGTV